MRHRLARSISLTAVTTALFTALSPTALGWGSYGHEEVNKEAAEASENESPFGKCLVKNIQTIKRYAITPDFDWKNYGTPPADPELRRLRASVDRYEHPLHFFEADAFVREGQVTPNAIAALPAGEWKTVLPEYQELLAGNIEYVLKIDPAKPVADPRHPTAKEVQSHGTAPWRIRQLYDLGVDSLSRGDTRMALVYLGTMGHYVGDMSQPFHASLNYDGAAFDPPAKGIHSVFESKILEEAAHRVHATEERGTHLWTSFAATEAAVKQSVRTALSESPRTMSRDRILPETLRLVGEGYPYINPLLVAFTEASERAGGHPAQLTRLFLSGMLPEPYHQMSVLQTAEIRLGQAAALLSIIWNSAYADAKRKHPALDMTKGCPTVAFDLSVVLRRYPKPTYLQ